MPPALEGDGTISNCTPIPPSAAAPGSKLGNVRSMAPARLRLKSMNDAITFADVLRIFHRSLDQGRQLALADSLELLELASYLSRKATKD